jgi:hypothetical protein
MKRRILGILAATFAAPCLIMLWVQLFDIFFGLKYEHSNDPTLFDVILKVIVVGAIVYLLFGIPLLLLSSLLAWLLHVSGSTTRLPAVAAGALLGELFAAFFATMNNKSDDASLWLAFAGCGALCGWIYWRIALRGQAAGTHAMDGP